MLLILMWWKELKEKKKREEVVVGMDGLIVGKDSGGEVWEIREEAHTLVSLILSFIYFLIITIDCGISICFKFQKYIVEFFLN